MEIKTNMIKNTEKQLERVNNAIASVKEYQGKLSELQSENKDVFWKALKKIIEKSKLGHSEKIRQTLGEKSIDHPGNILGDVKFMAGAIQAYDEVLNLVENNQDSIDEATTRIKELQANAESIKSNLDIQ